MGAEDDDDISPTLAAKSDQLNADDLIGGPIVVRIEDVTRGDEDQPVVIRISGGHQPWKPSKTARRCLATCWGPHARTWIGRSVELYRDPEVMFGGVKVGGIRVKAASGIDKPVTVMLASTRGKKAAHRIDVLKVEQSKPPKPRDAQQDDAPAPNADDFRQSVRLALREMGADMTEFLEFVQAKTNKDPGPPDTWNLKTAQYLAGKVRGEWAADLRTYLAPPPPVEDDDPFGGNAA